MNYDQYTAAQNNTDNTSLYQPKIYSGNTATAATTTAKTFTNCECATSVNMREAPGAKPGKIKFKLDNSWGPAFGTLEVPGGGDGKIWTTLTCKIKDMKGVHALHLSFSGKEKESFNVDSFVFKK